MHSALCKEENVQAGTNGGDIALCKMCTGANGGDVVHTLKSGKCTNRPARMSERYSTLKRGKCTGWPARMPRRYCTAGKKVAATIRPWGSSLYHPISRFHTHACKFLRKYFTNIHEKTLTERQSDVRLDLVFRCLFSLYEILSHVSIINCPDM